MRNLILIVTFLFLLVACENKNVESENLVPLTLEFLSEKNIQFDEEIDLKVLLLQGDNIVDDAYEVQFEIWQDNMLEKEQIKATNIGDGIYQVTKNFNAIGNYHIIVHTTARGMHIMPEFMINVQD